MERARGIVAAAEEVSGGEAQASSKQIVVP
jgi:hypothetical protein